jgi:hypothetical protein
MTEKITDLMLSAMLFALCVSVQLQQPKKISRIGYLSLYYPATDATRAEAIRLALRDRGYIEGQNFAIEYSQLIKNFCALAQC